MLSLIVAHDRNKLIGKENQLPWHLPNDLAFFKKTTMGKTMIMGRNTFESIGKPLPGRKSIVLTRQNNFKFEGVEIINDLDSLRKFQELDDEYLIIGGEEIFKQTLPLIDKMYVTYIDEAFEGDTFFPEVNENEWNLISEEKGMKDSKNPYDYYFRTYVRK
ncbi:dihydrofolate reductase [Bacillus sp. FJAT-29937]|uniref:dihydrofolate reductase n=1 Tax=Bacillus sp. FJAT-29937 TaxID=1720553 RepID=UPI00082B3DD3|nr:dihydrofolate reductase [Bacillus sp. FJAT-29937]